MKTYEDMLAEIARRLGSPSSLGLEPAKELFNHCYDDGYIQRDDDGLFFWHPEGEELSPERFKRIRKRYTA